MNSSLPTWVCEAATLPLAFAQVREDPQLDLEVVQRIGAGARVMMVGSGGCTAAFLASSKLISHLHVVDLNPAQLALSRLKLHLLQVADTHERLQIMGHAPMPARERRERLWAYLCELDLSTDALGPLNLIAEKGPDYAGRYERVFAELRVALQPMADALAEVLNLCDLTEQSARVAPDSTLGNAIDDALNDVMALPNLIALFGKAATCNRAGEFSNHFAQRTRWALANLPAASNPYLWQMYRGVYPHGAAAPWFTCAATPHLPEVSCAEVSMTTALKDERGEFDFVHLSNILDWLSHDEAQMILELAASALRQGGWVLVRQLNSTLEIPSLGPGFFWHRVEAEDMHALDRSFFYRQLHLGRKR